DSSGIQVALTVTPRTGFGRFTYPSSREATMLINAGGSATGNAADGTGVHIVGNDMVVGSASSGRFCGNANAYTVYFAAQFDQTFTGFGVWNASTVSAGARKSNGSHTGAYLSFDTTQNHVVQVKVGISFVSVKNAQQNLQQENPVWNFDTVRTRARTAWNERLNEIQVSGG